MDAETLPCGHAALGPDDARGNLNNMRPALVRAPPRNRHPAGSPGGGRLSVVASRRPRIVGVHPKVWRHEGWGVRDR